MRRAVTYPLCQYLVAICIFVSLVHLCRLNSYLKEYPRAISSYPQNAASIWSQKFSNSLLPAKILEWSVCSSRGGASDDSFSILIAITTTTEKFQQRQSIRRGWAEYFMESHNARLLFAMGQSSVVRNESIDLELRTENEQYGDMIVWDFSDTYHNLSLKMACTFRWIHENCAGVKFVLKSDDDSLIFGPNLMRSLKRYYGIPAIGDDLWTDRTDHRIGRGADQGSDQGIDQSRSIAIDQSDRSVSSPIDEPLFHCHVYQWAPVYRKFADRKLFLPFELYPSHYLPPYCSGHVYLLTRSALNHILPLIDSLSVYNHVEDALFTGILAQKAGIRRVHHDGFQPLLLLRDTTFPWAKDDLRWTKMFAKDLSLHYVKRPEDMLAIWRDYVSNRKACFFKVFGVTD